MNALKARRRWLAWCRYVDATGTQANRQRGWGTYVHNGQAKAYEHHMFAGRSWPRGARVPFFPKWGNP